MALNVLGVGGSMRMQSYSTQCVRLCLEMAQKRGANTQFLNLRLADLPMYKSEKAAQAASVQEAKEMVQWADAFLLGTPDYHGSMSGAMKNFLDYHWEKFAGKLFGYLCASHEKGLTTMDHMRTAVRQCYGWSLPYGVAVYGEQDFDEAGMVVNAKLLQRLTMLTRDLVVYGEILRNEFIQDLKNRERDTFAARYIKLEE